MTLTCPDCGCRDLELYDDNGVTKPPATRIEWFRCAGCGCEFKNVLVA